VIVAMNKLDLTDPAKLTSEQAKVAELGPDWPRIATSARVGAGVPDLVRAIVERLPEGPLYYPPDAVTDQPSTVMIAELIREKLLDLLSEEVPHSIAVVVDHMEDVDGVLNVDVTIYVERQSQKGIVIGKGGRILKEVGTRARADIEAFLGQQVFLTSHVKVARDWQRRDGMAERFGYTT
jgi:GTP-binding protein Era